MEIFFIDGPLEGFGALELVDPEMADGQQEDGKPEQGG